MAARCESLKLQGERFNADRGRTRSVSIEFRVAEWSEQLRRVLRRERFDADRGFALILRHA